MATKDSIMGLQEIYCEADGSNSGSDWDDMERDPDFDLLEETYSKFSNLSVKKKAKARVFDGQDLRTETDPEELEMTAPGLDEKDEKNFEQVQKIIEAGVLEKLKVHECKLYLRKNGLRLTGNKDTLIQRIREHLKIIHDGGEKKYPPSSFVLNCKGDACTGDVVLFEQNVYEMFSIASRSASGPPCGQRIVAGRIVKESYGAAKQQHTFTIEVLWSKGEKPLPPLYPLLIKGRNLYRLKTLRQRWDDERERQKILMEKHSRGNVARADREARIQEKEKRKVNMKNRLSKKESLRNRSESHPLMTKSQFQPQESDILINSAKPDFSFDDGMKNRLSKNKSSSNRSQSHPLVTKSQFQPQESAILINSAKPDFSFDDGMKVATIPHQQMIYHPHNQQALKRSADCRITYDHTRRAELGQNYNWPKIHSGEKQITIEKYPYSTETNRSAEWAHHRIPLTGVNHLLPLPSSRESYKQKQLCRHYAQGRRCHYGDNCKFLHDFREQVNRM